MLNKTVIAPFLSFIAFCLGNNVYEREQILISYMFAPFISSVNLKSIG